MGFTRAEAKPHSKLDLSLWAGPKRGKTHFSLTCPEPIYFFNFDLGLDPILLKFTNKEIYESKLYAPLMAEHSDYVDLWQRFLQDINWVYQQVNQRPYGTIVVDTGTKLWTLIQRVELDAIKAKRKDEKVYSFDYANSNTRYDQTINALKLLPTNLILIHQASPVYSDDGKKTGGLEIQCQKTTEYHVGVQMRLIKRPDDGARVGVIESCRLNPVFEGMEIVDPDYSKLAQLFGIRMAQPVTA